MEAFAVIIVFADSSMQIVPVLAESSVEATHAALNELKKISKEPGREVLALNLQEMELEGSEGSIAVVLTLSELKETYECLNDLKELFS